MITQGSFKAQKSLFTFSLCLRTFYLETSSNQVSQVAELVEPERRRLPGFSRAHFLLWAPAEKDDNYNFCYWIRRHQQQQHLHKWRHHQRQNRGGGFQGNYNPVSGFHRTGRSTGALEWTLRAASPPRLLAEWKILPNQALHLERIETGWLVWTQPIICISNQC